MAADAEDEPESAERPMSIVAGARPGAAVTPTLDRLKVTVSFDERHGNVASHPENCRRTHLAGLRPGLPHAELSEFYHVELG
jgi:hypothetical protein